MLIYVIKDWEISTQQQGGIKFSPCLFCKVVIARFDRAIRRKLLDYQVEPDNDKKKFTLSEFFTHR